MAAASQNTQNSLSPNISLTFSTPPVHSQSLMGYSAHKSCAINRTESEIFDCDLIVLQWTTTHPETQGWSVIWPRISTEHNNCRWIEIYCPLVYRPLYSTTISTLHRSSRGGCVWFQWLCLPLFTGQLKVEINSCWASGTTQVPGGCV